jgi:hypothetical protein
MLFVREIRSRLESQGMRPCDHCLVGCNVVVLPGVLSAEAFLARSRITQNNATKALEALGRAEEEIA